MKSLSPVLAFVFGLLALQVPVASLAQDSGNEAPSGEDSQTSIPLTDKKLNVLNHHRAVYDCSTVNLPDWGIRFEECFLLSNGLRVYQNDGSGSASFSPGYSMPEPNRLVVEPSRYGIGVEP